ncbi:amidohydrolase family protein [Nocardia goodfellowii]|uniref:amidohydrolase family protein n=1 Tax=Nocardia goodfellowii TaxID=882446 RepID=UPI001FDA2B57|nr:amidohydrolase family protein [Nocardia goodfellowii]
MFAALPLPDVAASVAEAVRALDELGADGVTLLSNSHGTYLGNLLLDPLLSVLDERGARAFVHPTAPPDAASVTLGRPVPMLEYLFDSARTAIDMVMLGRIDRFPRIQWIFSHGGGVMPLVADRVDFFRAQAGLDKLGGSGAVDALSRFWYDTAGTPFPRQLPILADIAGTDQIVYGSDYCFTPAPAVSAQISSIGAAAGLGGVEDWHALTAANAARLLRR